MSVMLRTLVKQVPLSVRCISNSKHDYWLIDKAPGMRKIPVPHEELLLENDGRYPPHLKIDMDHPENWPKHFPPYHEARRPDRWPLLRAVMWGLFFYFHVFTWLCPHWLVIFGYPGFNAFSYYENWGFDELPVD